MKIIVLNCGSSSIKYQLFDMPSEEVLAKGLVEKIGIKGSMITHKRNDGKKVEIQKDLTGHKEGIAIVLDLLTSNEHGSISDINEIQAVGHRVAHAGEKYSKSVRVNRTVIADLEECSDLAPLHNPHNLMGVSAIAAILPNVPQITVFDTAFHQTMPEHAYQYAIPYEVYQKYKVRRYGFHGSSHKFVSERAAKILGKPIKDLKIVTCHLGNGSSIAAIKNGQSIDTSMGMTPTEGLIMGTRVGNIDVGAVLYIAEKENMTIKDMNVFFNKKCGLQGVSGVSSDMRDVKQAAAEGNKRAKLALDMYYYQVKRYIGSYAAAMGGLDVVIFTGGIGENDFVFREKVCENMEFLGIEFDKTINTGLFGKDTIISKPNSKVKVMLINTNEELVIAHDTFEIVSKNLDVL